MSTGEGDNSRSRVQASRGLGDTLTNINDNLPHSRPNRATLMIALGIILGVVVIVFWPQISAFAHISQIRNALGL
jgi:hypothetical protein